jgi:hypothetical protein
VLQKMRSDGLIAFSKGSLTLLDYPRLEEAAGFNSNYLHIEERVQEP